ncbi:MAG: nucleotidyltransferase family protein [Candidatus Bathyarchaeia archaeon]
MPRKSSTTVKIYYPKFSREEIIQKLEENFRNLSKELPIKIVTLFGSYACGRQTAASDIDLFVVVNGKQKDEAYKRIYRSLNIEKLQLHLYTVDEYEKLRRNSPSFIKEAEENGLAILKVKREAINASSSGTPSFPPNSKTKF